VSSEEMGTEGSDTDFGSKVIRKSSTRNSLRSLSFGCLFRSPGPGGVELGWIDCGSESMADLAE